jgi:membrane protein involved in D-alanine export
MMILHSHLPFSTVDFFVFVGATVGIFLISKTFLSRWVSYRVLMAIVTCAYITLLFPKPIQLFGLVMYLYLALLSLRRWYKGNNIMLPMVVLAVPVFLLKTVNVLSNDTGNQFITTAQSFIQIAGLSYLVFKVIGLYIDERRSKVSIDFVDFFNFSCFVPTLLIGPIDRFQRFQSDVSSGYDNITTTRTHKGWNNFIKGLLFKFILAELIRRLILSHLVDDGSVIYHISYAYTYLMYLFFDFAGYSLLAIGVGNFIGVDVPINFDKPFLAVNPKEFWKRWHKSLGDWLGDYFFKPIFKKLTSKKVFNSIQRQNLALFLTFTLMGFWNGFKLNYIVSGAVFGAYSVIHNYYVYKCKRAKRDVVFGSLNAKIVRVISIVVMFNAVAFSIYIFSGKIL